MTGDRMQPPARTSGANILVIVPAVLALAAVLATLPAAAQQHCGGEYVVRPGDTLTRIAERCDSTVPGLVRANAQVSDPDVLLVGWRLTIPEALGHGPPGPDGGAPDPDATGEDAQGEDAQGEVAAGEAEAPVPAQEPGLVRLEGRVSEGPECPVLRTPDGQVYSLVGAGLRFSPGAYVEIAGRTVAMSFCMRGTTVEVTSLREIPAPPGQ